MRKATHRELERRLLSAGDNRVQDYAHAAETENHGQSDLGECEVDFASEEEVEEGEELEKEEVVGEQELGMHPDR